MTTVHVNPRLFANALDNVVEFSSDKKGLEVNDTAYVSWTGETMRLMGRGRYVAGQHDMAAIQADGEGQWEFIVSLDSAEDAAKALRAVPGGGAKDAQVSLAPINDTKLVIHQGESVVATLTQVDDYKKLIGNEYYEGLYEQLEEIAELPLHEHPPTTPIVWTRGVLRKLLKVRVGDPHHDADRFECHWIGGATWAYRIVSQKTQAAFTAVMESTRDGLE